MKNKHRAISTKPTKDASKTRFGPKRESAQPRALLPEHCLSEQPTSVKLEMSCPSADVAFITGSFNDWQPEATLMRNMGNGKWGVQLLLKPGRYEYLFVADGRWFEDPNARERVKNPHGGWNSILVIA